MHDGSRHFAAFPETYNVEQPQWERLRDWVGRLDGASLTGYVTDEVTEAWIDFTYMGHRLSINNQMGEWWFFVTDPACPDAILENVIGHFDSLFSSDLA